MLDLPQVNIEEDIWMQLPIGFQIDGQTEADSDRLYVIKLNKNLYGLKQGIYNWYEKLKKSLVDQDFNFFDIDPCLYIGKGMIILTYFDECIIVGPYMKDIYGFVESTKSRSENFVLNDKGNINKCLDIEITQLDDKIFKIYQKFLIDRITSDLIIVMDDYGMEMNANSTPVGKKINLLIGNMEAPSDAPIREAIPCTERLYRPPAECDSKKRPPCRDYK